MQRKRRKQVAAANRRPRMVPLTANEQWSAEFTGKALDRWAYDHGVELIFIRPGKPIENCLVESFNGRFRDECLNLHWFTHLGQARQVIERWRLDYNHHRPHSALGYQPPVEYARAAGLRPTPSSSAPPPPTQLRTEEALTC